MTNLFVQKLCIVASWLLSLGCNTGIAISAATTNPSDSNTGTDTDTETDTGTAICVAPASQVYTDTSPYELVTADNGGQVRWRSVPTGTGSPECLAALCTEAQLPKAVCESRLTTGTFAANIAQMAPVWETLTQLAQSPNVYEGDATIVTAKNLETYRAAIAAGGGTYVFRDTFTFSEMADRILVGSNTTIWIDGTFWYDGPLLTDTDTSNNFDDDEQYGVFEISGTVDQRVVNVQILGTKRGKIVGNTQIAAAYVRLASSINIANTRIENCGNGIFYHDVDGPSIISANFIQSSEIKGINNKYTRDLIIENNFIFDSRLDGLGAYGYASQNQLLRNVVVGTRERTLVRLGIGVTDNLIDNNIGIHVGLSGSGFREVGSTADDAPSARNTWQNNHVFYADSPDNDDLGFAIQDGTLVERETLTFANNFVWSAASNAYRRDVVDTDDNDVYFYSP